MIISAEMGESTADLSVIFRTSGKQFIYLLFGVGCLFLFSTSGIYGKARKHIWVYYFIVLGMLLSTRLFDPVGGAYGWIRIGSVSIQPSEFAKPTIILLASVSFEKDKTNITREFWYFVGALAAYIVIVFVYQNDFGSAFVIGAIGYICILISPNKSIKKKQNIMIFILLVVIAIAIFLMTPLGTDILKHFSNHYQIKRFLASADPFSYQYDSGYHLIMSLVSFASGGIFGTGYGKSIHKFMNFPNPSSDFILPVIIEEMGVLFGLIPILTLYGFIMIPLMRHASKNNKTSGKIVIVGTFMYFVIHFVLNVGGVSGLIPLTGVPLLLVSSGGSSLVACMASLGFSQCVIEQYRLQEAKKQNENNSREI